MERHVHPNVFMGSALQHTEERSPAALPWLGHRRRAHPSQPDHCWRSPCSSLLPWGVGCVYSLSESQTYTPCFMDTEATGSLCWHRTHPCSSRGNKYMGAPSWTPWKTSSVPSFCQGCFHLLNIPIWNRNFLQQKALEQPKQIRGLQQPLLSIVLKGMVHITSNFSFCLITGEVLLC